MAIRELTEQEYLSTFSAPMRRLGSDESYRPVALRDYVCECIDELELGVTLESIEIHHVYLSGDQKHSHVLFYFGQPNTYLVLVVCHDTDSIKGHRLLNLNKEYGIEENHPPK